MSKDKAGKKDKWKHLDLFDMMLKQSQVFRDMVGQFQSAWVPQAPSVVIEASMGTAGAAKKPGKTAKAAPVAAPTEKPAVKKIVAAKKPAVKKPAVKKAAASAKPAPAASKPSPRKSAGKARSASSAVGTVAARTAKGKATATRRVAKKK